MKASGRTQKVTYLDRSWSHRPSLTWEEGAAIVAVTLVEFNLHSNLSVNYGHYPKFPGKELSTEEAKTSCLASGD